MAKSLTKSATITKVAELASKQLGTELSKKQANAVLEALVQLAYKEAKNKFTVPGLGKLVLAESPAREMMMRFGPKAGQMVKVPKRKKLKFRVAKAAKDSILGA